MDKKPLVVVNGLVRKDAIAYLKEHVDVRQWTEKTVMPRETLKEWLVDADGLWCVRPLDVDGDLVKNAPNLKVIAQAAVGYDNVNIDELTAAGIPYGNTPGVLNETVAELAFTLIATASRRILENANFVKEGRWAQRPSNIKGFDLSRRTLGIIGMGAIGVSISMTLWAFLGLESACANADAVENPEKNVPIAVLGGTLGAAVIYIVSTNVIAGIVPNLELANSTAPFGLAFAHMFDETIGKVIMGLMVMSCFGSLLGWQFTIAQVFKSSAEEGYFPAFFKKVTSKDAPIVGMVTITALQTLLSLMTISPSLNKQFNVLVDLAVVTNVIPYLLSMAALAVLLKAENVAPQKYKTTVFVAFIGSLYSIYALYAAGEQAMLYGSIVTFIGWTLYGFVSYKFDLKKSQAN